MSHLNRLFRYIFAQVRVPIKFDESHTHSLEDILKNLTKLKRLSNFFYKKLQCSQGTHARQSLKVLN